MGENFLNSLKWGFLNTYHLWDHGIFEVASINWFFVEVFIFVLLILWYKFFRNSNIMILFELLFEKILEFFEDILWVEEKSWIKLYVTLLFFIILISNLLGLWLEFLAPIFWNTPEWHPVLEHYIKIPTADINFNIAMAIIWVIIVLIEQFKFLWFFKAIYEYVPLLWKDYIPYERWKLPKYVDIPLYLFIKVFDIIISVFLGLLEIVGHWAKIISLSFRLFWNITSGWLLLWMLYWGLAMLSSWLSTKAFWTSINFPIIFPDIIYFQELLVALIQALVFPLLIAIFIKVAKTH